MCCLLAALTVAVGRLVDDSSNRKEWSVFEQPGGRPTPSSTAVEMSHNLHSHSKYTYCSLFQSCLGQVGTCVFLWWTAVWLSLQVRFARSCWVVLRWLCTAVSHGCTRAMKIDPLFFMVLSS